MVINNLNDLPQPHSDSPAIVAVDNGYARQKIAYWADVNGTKEMVCFSLTSRAQMGIINISIDGKSSGVYDVNGQCFTVSERVLAPDTNRTTAYACSDLNLALVSHSLVVAGYGDREIILGTGLPFKDYYRAGEKNESFIQQVKDSFKVPVKSVSDDVLAIIKAHYLYPESTAAYVDFVFDEKTLELKNQDSDTVVVDIGGNTTDITMITAGTPTINIEKSSSRLLGVLNIMDELRRLIISKHGVDSVHDYQLDVAIRTGKYKLWKDEIDISELVKKAKQQTVKRLVTYINETIGDGASIENLLFVGGGAEALREEILESFPHGAVVDNAEFANARGMLKYITYIVNHG